MALPVLRYSPQPLAPARAGALHRLRVLKISTTRACWMRCRFCDFSEFLPLARHSPVPSAISFNDAAKKAQHADKNADMIKIRGGLSFLEPWSYYLNLVRILADNASVPIQAFSAIELAHFHRVEKKPLREMLEELRWAGAASLGPGGGDLLVDGWRDEMSPNRLPSKQWLKIHQLAGESGLQVNAMMLVVPGLQAAWATEHLQALAGVPALSILELKPLRASHTDLSTWGAPHLLELLAAVQAARRTLPDVRLAIDAKGLSDDALALLQGHGLSIIYDHVPEVL